MYACTFAYLDFLVSCQAIPVTGGVFSENWCSRSYRVPGVGITEELAAVGGEAVGTKFA